DDGAVSGGLDGYLRRALQEAEQGDALFAVVAALPREGYAALSRLERESWATQTVTRLGTPAKRTAGTPRKRSPAKRPAQPSGERTRPASSDQDASQGSTARVPKATAVRGLNAPVSVLARIQRPTIERLERVGVVTVEDMLWYFPTRHVDFTNVIPIAEMFVGSRATVVGTIQKSRVAFMGRGRRATEIVIKDESGSLRVMWFNQPYLAKQLPVGARVGLAGNVTAYKGKPQLSAPEWELLEREDAGTHVGRFVPVYPLTQGLPGRTVRKLARAAVEQFAHQVPESLPAELLEETTYPSEAEAIGQLHFPESMEARDRARERLALQELLAIQIAVLSRKREARDRRDAPIVRLTGDFIQT
ncbi:MAG TPA: OB-fold nucleic acid binding domain-containing protein, partial [Dehalococcoidia bacterium]|nr:OB-fold nucleic acid binding domain-containing protein [Dehalococcoidia bacterium]